jgi:hypothetical protein
MAQRLLIVLLNTFVKKSLAAQLTKTACCIGFLLVHSAYAPMKQRGLNYAQSGFLVLQIVIALCNLPAAFAFEYPAATIENLHALESASNIMMACPAFVCGVLWLRNYLAKRQSSDTIMTTRLDDQSSEDEVRIYSELPDAADQEEVEQIYPAEGEPVLQDNPALRDSTVLTEAPARSLTTHDGNASAVTPGQPGRRHTVTNSHL